MTRFLMMMAAVSVLAMGCYEMDAASPELGSVEQAAKPEGKGKLKCDIEPGAYYVVEDAEQCAATRFLCPEGYGAFFNECGCGCEPPSCVISGCSGQICMESTDEPVFTTCEFRPEYACYANATCERQNNGSCGWTQDTELRQCLRNAKGR